MSEATPGDGRLFRVFSKGTTRGGTDVERGAHWVAARRGWLSVFSDRLETGKWTIPFTAITHATLFRLSGLFGGYVLHVATADGATYQFGINPWALRGRQFPFPHETTEAKLRYSPFSIVLRIIVAAWLLAWVLGRL